jgi:hypothetical protein
MIDKNLDAPIYTLTIGQLMEMIDSTLTKWLTEQKPMVENQKINKVSVGELIKRFPGVLSKSGVYDAVYNGDMPHMKLKGKYVFDLVEVEKWLEAKKTKSKTDLKIESEFHAAQYLNGKKK